MPVYSTFPVDIATGIESKVAHRSRLPGRKPVDVTTISRSPLWPTAPGRVIGSLVDKLFPQGSPGNR